MRASAVTLLAFLLLLSLSVLGLNDFGLVSADEPRYASIGRDMARTGDWVTPHLWGEAWFEKPALLYWLIGTGHLIGLPGEWAARLPVALLSVAFVALFWRVVGEVAGGRAAWMASCILATSAGWVAYSRLAVTDLPLSACFGAGMLLSLEWVLTGNTRRLGWAGVCFGLAILAKGLAPVVLAAPLAWESRGRWRDWWRVLVPALVVSAPWYLLCTMRNGTGFLAELILKHHFSRFFTPQLQHVQPVWYFVPVLLAGLFPWTPLLALLRRPGNPLQRFLWLWFGFGFVFFSIAMNKLPGYLLPVLPAVAALLGIAAAREPPARIAIATSAALLGFVPLIAGLVPEAVASGTARALQGVVWIPAIPWVVGIGLGVWCVGRQKSGAAEFGLAVALSCASIVYLVRRASPAVETRVSARGRGVQSCVGNVPRAIRYGMNYYADRALPDCPDVIH